MTNIRNAASEFLGPAHTLDTFVDKAANEILIANVELENRKKRCRSNRAHYLIM